MAHAADHELASNPSDGQLHRLRIITKRVRYAADAAVPVFGGRARAFAEAAADLQDALGDARDEVMARSWLRQWSDGNGSAGDVATADQLAGTTGSSEKEDEGWRPAWDRLSAKRLRTWMS